MISKRIHFVSFGDENGNHIPSIKKVLDAGIDLIQLRIKNKSDDWCRSQAVEAKDLCEKYGAQLILNDRVDLARELKISAVHLGQDDMPILEAKKFLGINCIVGGTANTLDQMRLLSSQGVDYIGLGPYRFTDTKENLSPILGHQGIEEQLNAFYSDGNTTPIFIIGGIGENDFSRIAGLQIAGIAVSSLFSEKSTQEIKEIKQNFENGI